MLMFVCHVAGRNAVIGVDKPDDTRPWRLE